MANDYAKVPTTPEVWGAIMAAHRPQLVVFSSFSNPDGYEFGGDGSRGEMMTVYGLPGSSTPLIGARTTWDIEIPQRDDYTPMPRNNETHVYWLCATKEGE